MEDLYKSLTITIVLYKEDFELISKCLNEVKKFKIILIDNDGNYILKKKLEEEFNIYKYVINKENLGFSKAINQAIKLCDTKYILNLEADCLIKENSIFKLYESINSYKNCFITTPTMVDENQNLTNSGGALMEKKLGYEILNLEGDTCVDFPMTAAILFKKKDLIDIGLFDEDLFIYYPDCEIGRRIKKFKKSIIQIFDSRAVHTMGTLKIKNPLKRIFYRNYYFTIDELIYYYKENIHLKPLEELKKKIPKLIIKSIVNILVFRLSKSVEYFSRVLAYNNFKKKYLKNKKS